MKIPNYANIVQNVFFISLNRLMVILNAQIKSVDMNYMSLYNETFVNKNHVNVIFKEVHEHFKSYTLKVAPS
jgi:hypothetical protein